MPQTPYPRRVTALLVALLALAPAAAGQDEVRGTWLTTTGPDQIKSAANTETTVNTLDAIGLNTVYVEAWKNGYTNFASQTMADLVGADRSLFLGSARDLLSETTAAAHRRGLIHHAWFEYGFASQFVGSTPTPPGSIAANPLTAHARTNGWLLEDQAGNAVNASNSFAWMNPAVPEVRNLLVDITLEAIRNHDLDGIQFDDRLAWPVEFGFDSTTAALYAADTGRSLPASPTNTHFRNWRQSKVTQFAQQLNDAIALYRPDLLVGVSPSVDGFSQSQYNADWPDWASTGLFDEFVPQVYRNNLSDFLASLPDNTDPLDAAGRLGEGVIGIRFNGSGADTPLADVQQMIQNVRAAEAGQLAGHSLFYAKGLIDNAAAMTSFYGGSAANPRFAADHRPAPLVATQDTADADLWHANVADPEQYRVIAKIAGVWQVVDADLFEAGAAQLNVAGASAVELLIDRRPILGDTDFDRDVDLDDLATLAASIDGTGGLIHGDIDWDGDIDADDVSLLETNYGWGTDGSGPSFNDALIQVGLGYLIPEPGTAALLLIGATPLLLRPKGRHTQKGRWT